MIKPTPITAYLGVNGSGKSLSAIAFALRDLDKRGRPLLTNMVGLSAPHLHVADVEELPDMMRQVGREYVSTKTGRPLGMNIVLDEAGAMFSSRSTGRNKAFEETCQQLRKYRARLLWTAPTFARAEKILREVTFTAVLCTPLWQRSMPDDPWPSTRLILQKSFDVSRLDTSGTSINKNAKAKGFGFVRAGRWFSAFDSFATADGSMRTDLAGAQAVQASSSSRGGAKRRTLLEVSGAGRSGGKRRAV
jgi:hypothetical protein